MRIPYSPPGQASPSSSRRLPPLPAPPQASRHVDPASAMHWRHIGPTRAGRARARRRRAEPAERLLHRLRQRRRLALDRLRRQLGAALRPRVDRIDRRHRGRAVGSQRHLRRQRRRHHPARSRDRQRRLQVHRRRQDVDASRPLRQPDDREASTSRRAIRTALFVAVLGHPYGPNAGARHLPLDRRRQDASRRCSTRTSTPAATTCASIRAIPNIVYAALWQQQQSLHRRRRIRRTPTQNSGGIFKSTDGGTTWKQLTEGLPDGAAGEPRDRAEQSEDAVRDRRPVAAGGATAAAGAAGVAAAVQRRRSIYKTTDGGDHWSLAAGQPAARRASARAHRRRRSARR